MIGVDTNVLVRFLVQDDKAQADRASELFKRCYDQGTKCLITVSTLTELEWVLTATYQVTRDEIAHTVYGFLLEELFEIEESEVVRRALNQYRHGKGDLSDYRQRGVLRPVHRRTPATDTGARPLSGLLPTIAQKAWPGRQGNTQCLHRRFLDMRPCLLG